MGMSEFPERIEFADLDDEDLEESMAQIQTVIDTSRKNGESVLADALQSTVDRMARELGGREARYNALMAEGAEPVGEAEDEPEA